MRGCFIADLESVLSAVTRTNGGGEQGIMFGSSSLQRLMKINPDGVWAALQVVPGPPGSAKTL